MALTGTAPAAQPTPSRRPPSLREWLSPSIPGSRLLGWVGPLVVAAFAAFLRFDRLGKPNAVVFDETYYAKDAWSLLRFGYEHSTINNDKGAADKLFLAGQTDQIWAKGGSFVAHPPFGKWLIAIGEQLFGVTPFGWRFAAALFGTLSVLILARVARRMTGSTLLGCAAGLLLALDGLHLVTSRTAILDIFVMFWVLAAFACLVVDRDRSRAVLARKVTQSGGAGLGPSVTHWWWIPAGICLGLACATKWTGIFYVAAFGVLALVWAVGARRAAKVQTPFAGTLLLEAVPAFASLVVLAVVTYVTTWWGWIFNAGGWGRGTPSANMLLRPFEALPKLWKYHVEIWGYHTRLHDTHRYQSWPWDWPILRRPVAFYYTEPTGCGTPKCSSEVLGIGTPAIWWASIAALIVLIVWWLLSRDWRAGVVLLGYAAGWLPWFYYAANDRTMFLFYATPMIPFMVLAIVLVLGLLIGPADGSARRVFGAAAAGAYALIVLVNFSYLYPVLTAKIISYDAWYSRMWFPKWWI